MAFGMKKKCTRKCFVDHWFFLLASTGSMLPFVSVCLKTPSRARLFIKKNILDFTGNERDLCDTGHGFQSRSGLSFIGF